MRQFITLVTLLIFLALGATFWYVGTHLFTPRQQPTKNSSTPSCSALTILSPQPQSIIESPLSVNVIIDNTKKGCQWTMFEAQAGTVELVDQNGITLGHGVLQTTDDWTLTKPTPYNATFSFSASSGPVTLVIHEENPSGKAHPQKVTIPLSL